MNTGLHQMTGFRWSLEVRTDLFAPQAKILINQVSFRKEGRPLAMTGMLWAVALDLILPKNPLNSG